MNSLIISNLTLDSFNNIYVCNYTPLKNRRDNMIQQCLKYNISNKLVFINEYDREHLKSEQLKPFDTSKMKMAEISLFNKHMYAMAKIIDSGKPYGIIMEDDVIFKDNFKNNFNKILKTIPTNFDILYTGHFPFQVHYNNIKKKITNPIPCSARRVGKFKEMSNVSVFPWSGNAKGTDFYIISLKGCKKFMTMFNYFRENNIKILLPIDWYMGQMMIRGNTSIWWADEEITYHGSLTCKFNSSIR